MVAKITLYPRPVTAKAARLVTDNYAVVSVRNEDLVGGHATAAGLTFTFKPVGTGLTFVFFVRLCTVRESCYFVPVCVRVGWYKLWPAVNNLLYRDSALYYYYILSVPYLRRLANALD